MGQIRYIIAQGLVRICFLNINPWQVIKMFYNAKGHQVVSLEASDSSKKVVENCFVIHEINVVLSDLLL